MREALFAKPLPVQKVLCTLCPKRCKIRNHGAGECRIRVNEGGKLYAAAWGRIARRSVDPVERVPLLHFHPGSRFLSVGTYGCNFTCSFCNEWEVSQREASTEPLEPEDLVTLAEGEQVLGLAFRFNEPLIWFEYVQDAARAARKKGFQVVLHTNGYVSEEAFRELLPDLDAVAVDLKSMDETFLRQVCGGQLDPVLRCLRMARKVVWTEVTAPLIPRLTDTERSVAALSEFVASVAVDIPLHFLRFRPAHQMTHLPETPDGALRAAVDLARRRLKYVYAEAASGGEAASTRCPVCGEILVLRTPGAVECRVDARGQCPSCMADIPGKFKI